MIGFLSAIVAVLCWREYQQYITDNAIADTLQMQLKMIGILTKELKAQQKQFDEHKHISGIEEHIRDYHS